MLLDFICLFFPETCPACGDTLLKHEKIICSMCSYNLPESKFHLQNENPVEKLLRGRINIQSAATYLLFNKGGVAQKLIHELKYKGRTEIGFELGKLYGHKLKAVGWHEKFDIIVPVPLHKKKLKQRGFNQCDFFAEGLAESMGIQHETRCIERIHSKDSQTKKGRYGRWQNAEGSFTIQKKELIVQKNVLLVDDVVTTGATLEACAQAILSVEGTTVGIAAIAYTQN